MLQNTIFTDVGFINYIAKVDVMEEFPMDDPAGIGMFIAFLGAYFLVVLAIYVAAGFCLGKVFEKAGRPLWAGFVPIYNLVVIMEIVGRPTWWVVLFLVPFVGFIMAFIVNIDLAKSFGKTAGWGVLLTFFSIIMLAIMAFSDEIKYIGPSVPAPQAMQ